MRYDPKAVANFQLTRLTMCGDICPNPGLSARSKGSTKPKCNSCGRTIASNHRFVSCQVCGILYHVKCGGLKLREYEQLKSGNNGSWICVVCLFQVLPQEVSFNSLNDSLNDSEGSNNSIGNEAQ